jgi:chemotaxis signal transduction protein
MVCFSSGGTNFCLPVAATRAVRATAGIVALPLPRPGVTGILPGDPPLIVTSSLGSGGSHVLVIETRDKTFGLLVDAVRDLYQVQDASIGPAPQGQTRQLVSGTVQRDGALLLVADPEALAARV